MAREGGKRGWPGSNSAPPLASLPELPRVRAAPSVRAGRPLRLSSLRTAVRRPFRVQAKAGAGAGLFSRHVRAVRALRGAGFSHAGRPLRVYPSSLRTPCGGPSAPRRLHGRSQVVSPDTGAWTPSSPAGGRRRRRQPSPPCPPWRVGRAIGMVVLQLSRSGLRAARGRECLSGGARGVNACGHVR